MQNQNNPVATSDTPNSILDRLTNWRSNLIAVQLGQCPDEIICGQCCNIFSPEIIESRVCPDCGAEVPEVQL